MTEERSQVLEQVRRLARQHGFSPDEVFPRVPEARPHGVISMVLGYLGGLFLFAGISAFIAINWESFPAFARVGVTLGVGLAVFIAAVIVDQQRVWPTFPTPAYLAAEVLQPIGLLVAFEEFGSGGDWRIALLITGAVFCVQALAVLRSRPNAVLLFAAVAFGTMAAANVFDLADIPEGYTAVALGASLVLIALGIDGERYPWNVNAWIGAGSILFYLGAFDLLRERPYEVLFTAIGAVGLYLSVLTRVRAILVTSVAALLFYISYFTVQNFSDSLGWPVALMVIGASFVALGVLAVRFNRLYFRRSAENVH